MALWKWLGDSKVSITYNVKHTDSTIPPILVSPSDVVDDVVDVVLFGRINLEYGEELNENLLNILENFSCPEVPGNHDFLYRLRI